MFHKGLLAVVILITLASVAYPDVSINGYVQTDNRIRLREERNFTRNENRLGAKLEGNLSEKLRVFSELRFREFGFPIASTISELQDQRRDKVLPWGFEMREAYMDVYSFLTKGLDIRIGRQIIVWGAADRVNPTSNLCPDDLEDIFDLGEKLGVNALKASYYQKIRKTDITLTGVFIPVFTPSTLPSQDWAKAFMPDTAGELPFGMKLGKLTDRVVTPERKLADSSSFGVKLSTKLMNYDISLSYYRGRDKLPLLSSITLKPSDAPGTLDVLAEMIYPRIQVIGADLAGEIESVGVWAEFAAFFPEEVGKTILTPLGSAKLPPALEGEPYLKLVIGGDYNFKKGIYLNLQYLHGFMNERGKDELKDYFVARLEYKFHNDEVKIAPAGFAIEVDDWKNAGRNYGVAYMPEISYSPYDNVTLSLGAFLLEGKGDGLFSKLKDNDEFFFKAKMSF